MNAHLLSRLCTGTLLLTLTVVAAPGQEPTAMAHPRREFIPAMPTEVRAHLQRVEGTYEGRRIIYRCSEGSGRSLKEAVLLDGYNAVSGPRRERHWLAQHHPGASFEPGRTFDAQGRVYRLYQVTPPEGAVFTIFFDATYYDDLF